MWYNYLRKVNDCMEYNICKMCYIPYICMVHFVTLSNKYTLFEQILSNSESFTKHAVSW